jgi:hypothetical protein
MDSQPADKVEGVGEDFVQGGQDKTPTPKKRNSYECTVVKADTSTVTFTKGNEQHCAPWIVESPGGTVTTSAYNDGEKRCLSAEGGSGNPRKKVSEQNNTFTRAFRKSGHRLSENEIRAESHKRQKEMRGAARAAEMTEEKVALEKPKGLAEKAAARKAATEQAGKDNHAAGEAKRWAATGQADKDKHAGAEAARKAATGQEGKKTRAVEEAMRWAKKKLQRLRRSKKRPRSSAQSRQVQRELHENLTRKTPETHGAAWCAAEARKLNGSYFPGVSAHISLCALASFALAPPPALRCPSFVSADPAAPQARRRSLSLKSEKEPARPHSAAALGGGIFTLLRCTTDEFFFSCCDSVAAHFKRAVTRQLRHKPTVEACVDNTAKLRPHASVLALRAAGANQLLKPASTTPRSNGRRNRFWHHGHVHVTHNERRRGKGPVNHDRVYAWRLGHRHGHRDQAPATHNERRRGKRPGRNDEVPATHNERRREQWHEHHHHPPL